MRLRIAARGGEKTSRTSQPSGPAAPPCLTLGGITTQSPARITLVSSPTVSVSSPERTTAICCSTWWCDGQRGEVVDVDKAAGRRRGFARLVEIGSLRHRGRAYARPGPACGGAGSMSSPWKGRAAWSLLALLLALSAHQLIFDP